MGERSGDGDLDCTVRAAGDRDLDFDFERDLDLDLERFLSLEEPLPLLLLPLLGAEEEGGGAEGASALDAFAGVDLAGAGDGKPIYDIYKSTTQKVEKKKEK